MKRRPDRLESVKSRIPETWLAKTEFTTNWPGPVDGESIKSEQDLIDAGISLFPTWEMKNSNNSFWSRQMKLGEISCSFSHLSVWRAAKRDFDSNPNLSHVIVLEDDVKFDEHVVEKVQSVVLDLNRFGNWDFCYLGRVLQNGKKDKQITLPESGSLVLSKFLTIPGFSYCTYAYMLSKTGVEKLLNARIQDHLIPVDEFIPACYTVHPREDVAKVFKPCLKAFAFSESVVFQMFKCEMGSDTEASRIFIK